MKNWLNRFFGIEDRKSTIKTEIIAGLTTFFAMCYIVFTNPNMMVGENVTGEWQKVWNAVFIGSIISAVIGTLLMAFVAKMPFAQAAGMGLNSFFFVSFILPAMKGNGLTPSEAYGAGLAIILVSGIVFLLLSATGLRKYIATAMPPSLKKAIPAGIGLFIAFIGFKNSGLVVADRYTFIGLANLTEWAIAAPIIAFIIGLVILAVLKKFKIKGEIIISILSTAILYYLLTWKVPTVTLGAFDAFVDFGNIALPSVWLGFGNAFGSSAASVFNAIMLVITFCLVDMFDTVGTLYGTASQANMLDEKGDPINLNQCMLCDSIATAAGACLGSSTITTYVESSAGVAEGGRTGLTALVVAGLFFICLFLAPIAQIIPGQATAVALVYVGVLMMGSFKEVDLSDISVAIPAFLTMFVMPLTYSIANGIAIGSITYVLIRLATFKYTKQDIVVSIIAVLFAVRMALVFMGTYPAYLF